MMLYGGPGPPAVTLLAFGHAYGPFTGPTRWPEQTPRAWRRQVVRVLAFLGARALMAPARRPRGDTAIPQMGMPGDPSAPADDNGTVFRKAV